MSALINPALAVAQAMDGQLFHHTRLEYGANLYRAYPRDADETMPAIAAFVLLRSGEPVKWRLHDASELVSVVTVYVRGEPQRFEAGEDTARAVWEFLHRMEPPSAYRDCQVTDSEAEFAGLDGAGYPTWFINLRLIRDEE